MPYLEKLPDGCPPAESTEIEAARDVYRLVRTNPPTAVDFRSQREEYPDKVFHDISECRARGLSVTGDEPSCTRLLALPSLRGRLVCRVHLTVGAGRIQQTGRPLHHTWWPLKVFDILGNSSVVGS